jgi:hypothetical protein
MKNFRTEIQLTSIWDETLYQVNYEIQFEM